MIVPKSRTQELLHYFHDVPSAAHLGVDKTLEKLKNGFYWPNMKEYVQAYCRSCDSCFARKPKKESTKAPLGTYVSGEPMERVALDIFGPLPLTKKNNTNILVISDLFTKWTEAIALPNQESSTICTAFIDHFVTKFGAPLQLHSDQGRNFQADIFQRMCNLLGIHKTRTTSFRPQSNGGVERFNRTLASMLSMYCKQKQDQWDQYLQQVMMAYRSSVHASTSKTPNSMLFGREVTLPLQAVIPQPDTEIQENRSPDDYVAHLQNKLKENHAFARKALKKVSIYQKKRYDLNAKKRIFKRGEAVWIYDPIRKKGVCSKLTPKWKGPFIIEKRIDDVTYRVKRSLRQPSTVYHVDRLALYQGRNVPSWASRFRRMMDLEEANNDQQLDKPVG
ncbi:Hypothetical predicted protein [Mytilus galloprovincialis]|uniref:Integrase catalytic domain-containing protein n=1 Tax=Mytilus galloprovincialis TaxID=29158 RepID=A0A8B6G6V3_MYTGA|nr:Hypothetical predicted protein [Mytilus galloprovincialis]